MISALLQIGLTFVFQECDNGRFQARKQQTVHNGISNRDAKVGCFLMAT